jgi:hypothetical protein
VETGTYASVLEVEAILFERPPFALAVLLPPLLSLLFKVNEQGTDYLYLWL